MYMPIEEKKAIKAAKLNEKRMLKKIAKLEAIQNGTFVDHGINSSTPYEFRGELREGDWVCCRCTNFNYSCRDSCNKCGLM